MSRRLFACFRGKKSSSSTSKPSSGNNSAAVADDVPAGDGPVLVQLFSSQGCKTSPAAEMLMSRLGRGDFDAQIRGGGEEGSSGSPAMVLVFHVDYWDYKGWKDPYGSSQWTVRQKAYVEALNLDTMFTPQLVIQGRSQLVDNEEENLLKSIVEAPRFPSPAFKASFQRPTSETLQVSLTGAVRMKVDGNGLDIMVALYETGLVTDCERGENEGRMLSNDYVVRKMEKMCTVKDVTAKKSVSGTAHFTLWDGFNSSKCGVVVFLQNSSLHIFGTQSFKLPDEI
ncbi:Membrane lipoprotein lipid attachment site-like protein [Hirschfeldia incana]|nr:Membrane lipoprotein lipid attachment site-like protein [Hirschfeldia incana]